MPRRKKRKNKMVEEPLPRYSWTTARRKDHAPAMGLYHFVADYSAIRLFPPNVRPIVSMKHEDKMAMQYASYFTPSLERVLGLDARHNVWLWKIPKTIYASPQEFLAEAMNAGEIVCWFVHKHWLDTWINRWRDGRITWIVLVWETEQARDANRMHCECIAAFQADWIAYVPKQDTPRTTLNYAYRRVNRSNGLVRVCNVTTVSIVDGIEDGPFTFTALSEGYQAH